MKVQCGEYSCRREGKFVLVGLALNEFEAMPEPDRERERRWQAKNNIICGVHHGATKRQKYGRRQYEPLENRADVRLLAEAYYLAEETAQNEAAAALAVANRQRAEKQYADDWAEYDKDAPNLQNDTSTYAITKAGVVPLAIGDEREWLRVKVEPQQEKRYDDLPLPVLIRVNGAGNMTPAEARVLAKALTIMADRVEAANSLIRQEVK